MVGHVLDKVDKKNYPDHQDIFSTLWCEKKVDQIFIKFIDEERNDALKEYKFLFEPDTYQVETDNEILFQDGAPLLDQSGERMAFMDKRKTVHFASKTNQVEQKRLDLWIQEAIDWWTEYLEELKSRLNEPQNP